AALAIGFEIPGEAGHVADLVSNLRLAWRQEGSEAECLVEIEGPHPVVTVLRTWTDWVQLERSLRKAPSPGLGARTADAPAEVPTILAEVSTAARVLGTDALSWIDADDQILCLVDGKMIALPERVEIGDATRGE